MTRLHYGQSLEAFVILRSNVCDHAIFVTVFVSVACLKNQYSMKGERN